MSQHQVAAPVRDRLSAVSSGHDHLVDLQERDRCRDEALDRAIEQLRDSTSASLIELTKVREGDTSADATGEAIAILHRHVTQRQKLLEEHLAWLRPTVAHDHNPTSGRDGTGPRPCPPTPEVQPAQTPAADRAGRVARRHYSAATRRALTALDRASRERRATRAPRAST